MQPVEPARVPHQLLVSLDTTECDQSAAARLFRRPAGSDVLLHLQPDVELELLVQLTFHLVTPHYRAHPLDPPAQPHHGFLTLCGAENLLDQRDVLPPALRFLTECPPPRARELVVTGPTVLIRGPPLAVDPPLLFEPLQRRIQRPLPHPQRVVRHLLQPLRDRPTVQRPQRQHFRISRSSVPRTTSCGGSGVRGGTAHLQRAYCRYSIQASDAYCRKSTTVPCARRVTTQPVTRHRAAPAVVEGSSGSLLRCGTPAEAELIGNGLHGSDDVGDVRIELDAEQLRTVLHLVAIDTAR